MRYPLTRLFLGLSGALGAVIGLAILIVPHAFFATNDIVLGTDPNLMSEIRAPGGVLIAAGIIMMSGAALSSLIQLGLLTGAVVFSMYGISRLISLVLDGVPSAALVSALVIELIIGAIAALLIAKFGLPRSHS